MELDDVIARLGNYIWLPMILELGESSREYLYKFGKVYNKDESLVDIDEEFEGVAIYDYTIGLVDGRSVLTIWATKEDWDNET